MSDIKYLSIYAGGKSINFRESNGVSILEEIAIELKPNEILLLFEQIHKVVREGTLLYESSINITVGKYDLMIKCVRVKNNNTYDCTLSISGMENLGEKSKPIKSIKFDKYIGGKTMLEGIRKARKDFEEFISDVG